MGRSTRCITKSKLSFQILAKPRPRHTPHTAPAHEPDPSSSLQPLLRSGGCPLPCAVHVCVAKKKKKSSLRALGHTLCTTPSQTQVLPCRAGPGEGGGVPSSLPLNAADRPEGDRRTQWNERREKQKRGTHILTLDMSHALSHSSARTSPHKQAAASAARDMGMDSAPVPTYTLNSKEGGARHRAVLAFRQPRKFRRAQGHKMHGGAQQAQAFRWQAHAPLAGILELTQGSLCACAPPLYGCRRRCS